MTLTVGVALQVRWTLKTCRNIWRTFEGGGRLRFDTQQTAKTNTCVSLLLRLRVHVLVLLVAAFLPARHVGGGRHHARLAAARISVLSG